MNHVGLNGFYLKMKNTVQFYTILLESTNVCIIRVSEDSDDQIIFKLITYQI